MPNTVLLKELHSLGSCKTAVNTVLKQKKKKTILKIVMKGKQKVSHFDPGDTFRLS